MLISGRMNKVASVEVTCCATGITSLVEGNAIDKAGRNCFVGTVPSRHGALSRFLRDAPLLHLDEDELVRFFPSL